MTTAQAVAKGIVGSLCGNRAAGSLGRRRGAVAVRVGGSWRKSPFLGGRLAVGPRRSRPVPRNLVASPVQMNLAIGKAVKWWEKGLQPNMPSNETAQDLVDSLTNAGDRLVVVDFFSPGYAGCHALHPRVGSRKKCTKRFASLRSGTRMCSSCRLRSSRMHLQSTNQIDVALAQLGG